MTRPRLTAGIVLIRETASGCRDLLLRSYNHWDFSKGMLEANESPLQAAIREVAEETGINRLEFAWQQQYYQTEPYSNNKIARYYLARTDESEVIPGINPEPGHPEHHEFRWLPYNEAIGLLNKRLEAVLKWAHQTSGCDRK